MVVRILSTNWKCGLNLADTGIGIVRCDMIAEAIVAAAAELGGFKCPVVIRLQGTNSEKGLKLVSRFVDLL